MKGKVLDNLSALYRIVQLMNSLYQPYSLDEQRQLDELPDDHKMFGTYFVQTGIENSYDHSLSGKMDKYIKVSCRQKSCNF